MRLLSVTSALGLTLAALAALPVVTAGAAGETCEGVPATVVGTPGQPLIGSEGRDVIVTNGALSAAALGGDDLICLTDGDQVITVDAGAGADRVVDLRTSELSIAIVGLGGGADSFVGGDVRADVTVGASGVIDDVTVTLGPARDRLVMDGLDDGDRFQLSGGGFPVPGPPTPNAPFSQRGDLMVVDAPGASYEIDARAGTLTGAGALADLTGFSGYSVIGGSVGFTGTDADESVRIEAGTARIDTAGGDDSIALGTVGAGAISGGIGRDELWNLVANTGRLEAHLPRRSLRIGSARLGLGAVEVFALTARRIRFVGTDAVDRVRARGCRVRLDGRNGGDALTAGGSDVKVDCDPAKARYTFLGGRGNDRMTGSKAADLMIGGRGIDRADGGRGRNECRSVERPRRC